ncbi:Vesicle-associated membrane protein-associated protein SCS2 Short=VAMP-associated protein SCS2; AltName: Full=VAP homolog 1; AltName: Full=Choline sensitivity suppressor protein 2 [Cyberlindnera jadinii]|uniref:SCS2 protein n=1 Tax=Cyberlindnera jadinii (strain ATCC 18201 / CBS 1600 / BCRC 20928 / JCM 3617 / NBRC 0987 / NRRL Y-1542) TaxID=983966 RepID=A0A0H5C3S6_CYBJN|nr:Vesicle-associated membrane protein-associated protein SCS2 Short=VAMP-associated protein SCS2; AltName: Full=VAP homolog 1; AltName: Full=Choline sensitivity suppressor protein 2 [Cyberlindnera jadinii]
MTLLLLNYCVRPNSGLIHPGESVEVSVILLGLQEEPEAEAKCNDKFLIIALPAPYDLGESTVAEVWPKLESEFKPQSVSTKIKVKFVVEDVDKPVLDSAISTGVNGKSTSEQQEQQQTTKDLSSSSTKELAEKVSEDVSQEDKSKIDALNEKLDSNVAKSTSEAAATTAATSKVSTANKQESPAPLTTIVLLALIAIILAWLFM